MAHEIGLPSVCWDAGMLGCWVAGEGSGVWWTVQYFVYAVPLSNYSNYRNYCSTFITAVALLPVR